MRAISNPRPVFSAFSVLFVAVNDERERVRVLAAEFRAKSLLFVAHSNETRDASARLYWR
jgi:hypothetical protein